MKTFLVTLAAILSFSAHADGVLKTPDGSMIVFNSAPCTHEKVAPQIKDELLPLFKSAAALINGKLYAACWAINPNNRNKVHFIDEEGDSFVVPYDQIVFDAEV